MNVVSFETAKRLKEAGFPQPIQRMGQWWYDTQERLTLTAYDGVSGDDMSKFIFAPTATDLIPPNWMLVRRVSEWECVSEYELDNFFSNAIAPENYFHHENPAEAAAMAWLHVNKTRYGTDTI